MKTLTEALKACGGVWPSEANSPPAGFYMGCDTVGNNHRDYMAPMAGGYVIYRPEFESEAARLSGKPGWGEAPEGYNWRWQNADGGWKFGKGPKPENDGRGYFITHHHSKDYPGMVLGDWRDTLERRPEVESVVDTDGDQILNYYMPLVGEECECWDGEEWHLGVSVGPYMNGWLCMLPTIERPFIGSHGDFRPLKSDRERWVETALESAWNPCPWDDRKKLQYIYDALKSGELPMPEAK